jgi:predicted transcriptional regulator
MEGLNEKEKKILKYLLKYKGAFPINHIARAAEISWETAQTYLKKLEEDNFVIREEKNGKERWRLNFDQYKELRERFG